MKNLLRVSATLLALTCGGIANADVLSITETPDVFQVGDLPATSLIRIFYQNESASAVTIDAVQFRVLFDPQLDADVDNNGSADGFAALPGFVFSDANAADPDIPVMFPGKAGVLIGAVGTGSTPSVAAGSTVELFRFNLFVPGGTPEGIYPLTFNFIELVLNGTPTNPTLEDGAIVVQAVPEPASLAMAGLAGLFGLGVVARRRLARKAD